MDPAWSPDGKRIAFSTDRFTTNLETIKPGELQAGADRRRDRRRHRARRLRRTPRTSARSGRRRPVDLLPLRPSGHHEHLPHRQSTAGKTTQLTNMLTGASGITALSPAMSAASGRLAVQRVRRTTATTSTRSTRPNSSPASRSDRAAAQRRRAAAPTRRRRPRRRGAAGLRRGACRREAQVPVGEPYKPKWGLDFAGQPSFGVGVDPFGTYATGGVVVPLQRHAGQSRHRHVGAGHQPVRRVRRDAVLPEPDAPLELGRVARPDSVRVARLRGRLHVGNTYVEREYRFLQRDQSVTGFLTLSVQPIAAGRVLGRLPPDRSELRPDTADLRRSTGQQLDEGGDPARSRSRRSTSARRAPRSSSTRRSSGPTSPIRGSRYRLEFIAERRIAARTRACSTDLRTYLMPVRPYTIALRGMYYGRLGDDAEDGRLPALFLGYPGLVRGYDQYSFESSECVGGSRIGSCPAFDRLIGSRVADRQRRAALPGVGRLRRRPVLRSAADRRRVLRRRRRGVGPQRPRRASLPRRQPAGRERRRRGSRQRASASRLRRSTTSGRSTGPARGWLWQFSSGRDSESGSGLKAQGSGKTFDSCTFEDLA